MSATAIFRIAVIAFCSSVQSVAAAELARYTVTVSDDLATMTVAVKAIDAVDWLVSGSPEAAARLGTDSLEHLSLIDGRLGLSTPLCGTRGAALYSADLRPKPSRRQAINTLVDAPLALTDHRQWLWLPAELGAGDRVLIEFVLPKGIGVATPWKAAPKTASAERAPVFELGPSMLDEESLVVFGTLNTREIALGGATLRLSVASADPAEVARFGAWAEGVWRATRTAVAAPPGSLEQLLVVPIKSAREAVPWGEVRRGTGNSVLALVNRIAVQAELIEDWTLYHELSHVYLPYLGGDRWLSEGFASYYQNVLRARAGVLAPEAAWRELAEGLARGAKAAKADQTVEEGGRMVTYWTGAALALEWDIALREKSGGKESLDTLLARFAAAELPARRMWNATEVAAAFDRASAGTLGKDYFSASMSRVLAQRGFPDHLASFKRAGIDPATGKARPGTPVMFMALMRPPRTD
jgi:hypothetical protein